MRTFLVSKIIAAISLHCDHRNYVSVTSRNEISLICFATFQNSSLLINLKDLETNSCITAREVPKTHA